MRLLCENEEYYFYSFIVCVLLGTENVQGAQKYITGLDARRLSKYPEQRYFHQMLYAHPTMSVDINVMPSASGFN